MEKFLIKEIKEASTSNNTSLNEIYSEYTTDEEEGSETSYIADAAQIENLSSKVLSIKHTGTSDVVSPILGKKENTHYNEPIQSGSHFSELKSTKVDSEKRIILNLLKSFNAK